MNVEDRVRLARREDGRVSGILDRRSNAASGREGRVHGLSFAGHATSLRPMNRLGIPAIVGAIGVQP
jgi:hypothetical protein